MSFAIRYRQALLPGQRSGYEYPDLYRNMFGEDYVPPPHIEAAYKMLRKHKWYMRPRHLRPYVAQSRDRIHRSSPNTVHFAAIRLPWRQ